MPFLLLFLFFLFFPLQTTAEEGRVSLEGSLALGVDACSFRGDDGPYEEVVIRFPAAQLAFETRGDSLFVARYIPRLELFDENGNSVKRIEGERVFSSAERIDDPEHFVYDIARFQVPAGYYHAVLKVKAVGNDRQGRAVFSIEVPEFKTGQLAFSDLFFVSEIDPSSQHFEAESFLKGGHVLLPLPEREVGGGAPLRFYVELYEIGRLAHSVRFQIRDRFGSVVFDHRREFPTYRGDAKFVEGIPLRGLSPGTYTLSVEARIGDQIARTQRDFRIAGSPVELSLTAQQQVLMEKILERFSTPEAAREYAKVDAGERAVFMYGHYFERVPLFAQAYIAPVAGLGNREMGMTMLRAIGLEETLKKRVDKTFGERLPEADTLAVRRARDMVDFVLEEDPRDPRALTARALIALESGALVEGERWVRKALDIAPDLPEARNALGIVGMGRGDWNGAVEKFQEAAYWTNAELARFLSGKGEGLEYLKAAVGRDPTHPFLYYMMGRVLERRGELAESAVAYRRQIAVDPLFARARFDFGRVLFKQGRIDSATVIWRDLMEARPDFRSLCMHPLLEAYLNIGETGKAHALIAEELRTLSDEARERVEDISLVAGPEEVAAYQRLAPEERAQFVRAFWQKRDPTPATPGNERLVEHYRRVVYVLQNFSKDGRKWDRRGDVYIRYGEPAHVSKRSDIRFETDARVVRVKERLIAALSPEAKQEIIARIGRLRTSTRDVEIETELGEVVAVSDFESIDFEMNPNRVFFARQSDDVNTYVRGKELFGRDRPGMSERPMRGIPLYPVNGSEPWEYWIYPDVSGGIEVVFTALTPKGDFDFPDVSQGRKIARFNQRFWEDTRPEVVISRAVNAQPDRYVPVGKGVLDFHSASADFRGADDKSRLEVYYGVPVLDAIDDGGEEVVFERGIALFDSSWTPIYRRLAPMPVRVDVGGVEAGTLAIDELALQVLPGRYYLGLQINHPASGRRGGYTQELVVEDYAVAGLKISDIELAGRVQVDSLATDKGGVEVISLPSRTYKIGQPVVIYYEVYDLKIDDFGQTKYRVDYRITPREGKLSGVQVLRALGRLLGIEEKAVVTISYERTGTGSDEYNYLEIDPGESKPGRYEIAVAITDLNGEQTAEKTVIFFIGE
ncbi:MAG: GWxTD domain-containing protein [Gemmatimonadetes bacterium]|nr:GWxTD domain-containing protein [Gemmatimonadota bacterium]